ncbi:XRE family transcriptional regulator [Paenibacillus anaericanus]|uniref:XRE family transcriptional regulator n=1 Tax=Paenibacillus anaericanus TaxID=170367 RepID=A0A433Y5W0_9BACL|nr:helix-turn-helix transcriptional regulator [Paenibacillus anaericanus]RUT43987.1 XRE family transcriptional regulator [Paenibacillus anaericanus]
MKTIGGKVKAIRLKHELNQIAFADKIGISQGRLSEIEQGKTKPSAETLKELRKKLMLI